MIQPICNAWVDSYKSKSDVTLPTEIHTYMTYQRMTHIKVFSDSWHIQYSTTPMYELTSFDHQKGTKIPESEWESFSNITGVDHFHVSWKSGGSIAASFPHFWMNTSVIIVSISNLDQLTTFLCKSDFYAIPSPQELRIQFREE